MASDNLLLHFSKPQVDNLLVLDRAEGPYVFDTDGNRYIDALSSLFCAQIGYSYGAEMAEVGDPAADHAAVQHELGDRPPGGHRAGRAGRVAAPRPTTTGSTSPRWLGGGRGRLEVRPRALRRDRAAAAAEGDRPEGRVPRRHARRAVLHRHSRASRTTSVRRRSRSPTSPTRTRSGRRTGTIPTAFCARLLAEVEQAVLDAGPDEVALIIAEPVQNAGGSITPPAGYWQGLREIADRYGILLMADEVISGFGRIGEWFAVSREGVAPDLITVAKGLTSAYAPMGAVLARSSGDRAAGRRTAVGCSGTASRSAGTRSARRSRSRTSRSSSATRCCRTSARWHLTCSRGWRSCAPCRSSATSAAPGSSGPSRWSPTPTTPGSTRRSATS